jgi:transposase-like protein
MRRRYSQQEKDEAIAMVVRAGLTRERVAELLAIPLANVARWVMEARAGKTTIALPKWRKRKKLLKQRR